MKNLLILFLLFFTTHGMSCTTFVLKDSNNLVFGRNLDWFSDNGIAVVNKRNVKKTALVFPPEKPVTWTSRFGSVTLNQFGKEFPFGGINEKGLVVELMVVNTFYPQYDDRLAINELQWVQFQLDNCSTIDEVIKSDKYIRISKINQDLHFLICDKSGNTAVIEFSESGMIVYKGNDLPYSVLENDTYSNSLISYKNDELTRFSTATDLVKTYTPSNTTSIIDYSFNILDEVTLDSSWSIVYDIKNMQIHFRTASNRKIRQININSFDYNCKIQTSIYDLKNKTEKKLINSLFEVYKNKINRETLEDAIKSNMIVLPKEILDQFYSYNESCECQSK